jgi:hypothetical protein
MTAAKMSGCKTSLSCRTDTVTKSMKVIPSTQCRSIDPTKFFEAKVAKIFQILASRARIHFKNIISTNMTCKINAVFSCDSKNGKSRGIKKNSQYERQ